MMLRDINAELGKMDKQITRLEEEGRVRRVTVDDDVEGSRCTGVNPLTRVELVS
jgi:hypothetical protein